MNPSTGELEDHKNLIKGKDKEMWLNYCSNELGILDQGIRDIKSTASVSFRYYSDVPKDKKYSYARIVFSIRPKKGISQN